MRIAFSGTHRAGKTTLLEAVAGILPRHRTLAEPYHVLEEEGYEHADPPALEDYEAQLEQSLSSLEEAGRDVLFDRSPLDVIAYALSHEDADAFELSDWMERVRDAVQTLDLVVFVPLEEPDRIPLPGHEDKRLRRRVHKMLERIWLDDSYGLEPEVLMVEGDPARRLEQVRRALLTAR